MGRLSAEQWVRLTLAGVTIFGLTGCASPVEDDGSRVIGGPAVSDCRTPEDIAKEWDSVATFEFPVVPDGQVCGVPLVETAEKLTYIRISDEWVQVVILDKTSGTLSIAVEDGLPTEDGDSFDFQTYDIAGKLTRGKNGYTLWYSTKAHHTGD